MQIICLVKFVPKVDDFEYDDKRHVLIRTDVGLVINPDDACALEYALSMKDSHPDVAVEVVSMGPTHLQAKLEDLIRRGADKATLISDKSYLGSDTYATAHILSAYLEKQEYDLILSGSQTLDGDTGHVGPQVAELLDLPQCSNVIKVEDLSKRKAVIKVDNDDSILTLSLSMPALLSLSRESNHKLRFAKLASKELDVSQKFSVVSNHELALGATHVGLQGSPTKVKNTYVVKRKTSNAQIVTCDEAGVEVVYDFLKSKGVI